LTSAVTKPYSVPIHSLYMATSFCTTGATMTSGGGPALAAGFGRNATAIAAMTITKSATTITTVRLTEPLIGSLSEILLIL
jgi:hypothetical protein